MPLLEIGFIVLAAAVGFAFGWFVRKNNPKDAAKVDPITNKL